MKTLTLAVLGLLSLNCFALTSYTCEEERSGSIYRVEVEKTNARAVFSVFKGATLMSGTLVRLETSATSLRPLIENNMRAMDKKEISDKDSKAFFKIDGYDFEGKPRLAVRLSTPKGEFSLSGCTYLRPDSVIF